MIIVIAKYLIPKGFSGFTVFPFVILANQHDRCNKVLLDHERIHLRQQAELLVLPFFVWYGIEYLFRLAQSGDRHEAYKNIGFEKEAYANEGNPGYLVSRPFLGFCNYL
jgi:hypothetical protein